MAVANVQKRKKNRFQSFGKITKGKIEAVGAFVKMQKVKTDRFGAFVIFQREGCSKFRTMQKKEPIRFGTALVKI